MQELDLDHLVSSEEVISLMKEDLDTFAQVSAPEDATLNFPNYYCWLFFQIVASFTGEKNFAKFAVGLPRGHGKTFFVKLMLMYAILFTGKQYILVIGANTSKGRSIISDVAMMLSHPNIISLFGDWREELEQDTQDLKKFKFAGRNIILECAGQGTAIRGTNQKNLRPDIILLDDAQTAENAKSATEAENYQQWFSGTVMKAKSPKGCSYIYIGNMYPDLVLMPDEQNPIYTCMLRNLQLSPDWKSLIVGCILADGTALWEELHPLAQLLEEYRQDKRFKRTAIFHAEMLNNPLARANDIFNPDAISVWDTEDEDWMHNGSFIAIDPATSKATPDQMVISYNELYGTQLVIREIIAGKFTAPQSVWEAIKLLQKWNCGAIAVEDNAYQFTLCEWLRLILEQSGMQGVIVLPIGSSGNKNARISAFLRSYSAGEVKATEETVIILNHQAASFRPERTDNVDDILDTGALAQRVAIEFRDVLPQQYFPSGTSKDLPRTLPNTQPY